MSHENGKVCEVGDETFASEVLEQEGPVLVEFGATWCGPCRVQEPIVHAIASSNPTLKVVKIDVDDAPKTAAAYGVRGVPTVLVFKGGAPTARQTGLASREKLEALLG